MAWEIRQGDWIEVLRAMPDESVHCCVTSPPYWGLRDYGVSGQLGLERTPEEYVAKLVDGFRELRRVLRLDGTLWLNLGDCYHQGAKGNSGEMKPGDKQFTNSGSHATRRGETLGPSRSGRHETIKPKDLCGIPWMTALALRLDGWYLRSDIIWHKPNQMCESVEDRPSKSHEYLFLLARSSRYYYDADAIAEPIAEVTANDRVDTGRYRPDRGYPGSPSAGCGRLGNGEKRNKRTVWTVTNKPFPEAHTATFPPDLVEPCILAGCPEGGTVLDPFCGAGTTGLVATHFNRNFIGIELKPEYVEMGRRRIAEDAPLFNRIQATQEGVIR